MEEEIKKELKEIREEVEKRDKDESVDKEAKEGSVSEEKEKTKENISEEAEAEAEAEEKKEKSEVEKTEIDPDRAEGLVEKLVTSDEETDKEKEEKKIAKFSPKELIYIIGSIVGIVLSFIGIWVGVKLIKGKINKGVTNKKIIKKEISKEEKKPIFHSGSKTVVSKNIALKKISKVLLFSKNEEENFNRLELKNFLIPLSSNEFLTLDVTLYFDNKTSLREIMQKKLDFKEKLYSYLKKIPPDKWKNPQSVKLLQIKIKEALRRENVTPLPKKIKLEGVILKG